MRNTTQKEKDEPPLYFNFIYLKFVQFDFLCTFLDLMSSRIEKIFIYNFSFKKERQHHPQERGRTQHHPRNEVKQRPTITWSKLISSRVGKRRPAATNQGGGKQHHLHGRGRGQHHTKEEEEDNTTQSTLRENHSKGRACRQHHTEEQG